MTTNSQYGLLDQFSSVLMPFGSKNRVMSYYDPEDDECLKKREQFAVSLRKAKKA